MAGAAWCEDFVHWTG